MGRRSAAEENLRAARNQAGRFARRRGSARHMQDGIRRNERTRIRELQERRQPVQHSRLVGLVADPVAALVPGEDRRRLCLSIAGLGALIQSDQPDLEIEPQGAVSRFVADEIAADLTVRVRWTTKPARPDNRPRFDSGGAWRLERSGDHFLFHFISSALGPAPYKTARVNPSFTSSEVTLHRPYFAGRRAIYPLEYPLDELLFIHLLALGRGVELHGCAVVDASGEASLFIGQSGAGKSTTARLWHAEPGVTILSDDRIIVREIGGLISVYGTPWHGDEPFASSGPGTLARIFFLRHGSAHRLRALTPVEATARLFACSFVPVYDANAIEFTLALLARIAGGVPCCELQFAPDRSVVDFIRRSEP